MLFLVLGWMYTLMATSSYAHTPPPALNYDLQPEYIYEYHTMLMIYSKLNIFFY